MGRIEVQVRPGMLHEELDFIERSLAHSGKFFYKKYCKGNFLLFIENISTFEIDGKYTVMDKNALKIYLSKNFIFTKNARTINCPPAYLSCLTLGYNFNYIKRISFSCSVDSYGHKSETYDLIVYENS